MEQKLKVCPLCDGELSRKTRQHVERIGSHNVKDASQLIPFCATCNEWFISSEAKQRYERKAALVALNDLPRVKGDVLKDVRKILGLKQAECAALLDMDVGTISRYETDAQPVPRYVQLAFSGICAAVDSANGDTSVLAPKDDGPRSLRVAS